MHIYLYAHTDTVLGALGAFGFGWGTGANDVSNAMETIDSYKQSVK
jgi:homoaconitase/3-isopropylmalate dehydratase large subunit